MSHKSYRRNDLKNKVYQEIAKEMGMAAEIVQKKIRSLRITYTGEKRKMTKKSGSGAEENYVSSLKWFNEMSFLDSSIVTRKTMDNSVENNFNSTSCEEFEDSMYEDGFENKTSCFENNTPRKATSSKIDKALEKLLEENESEFVAFGTSVAQQLEKVPVEVAYELMGEIQNTITKRKIKCVRESRTNVVNSSPSRSNIIFSPTPTSSNIVNLAITNAQIDLHNEYETVI